MESAVCLDANGDAGASQPGAVCKALQGSHATADVDCRPFIDFMLDAIANSLYKYIDVAVRTVVHVGVNIGVSAQILALLTKQPQLSAGGVI
jgi:hypothetical protein